MNFICSAAINKCNPIFFRGVVRNNGPYDFAFKTVRESLGGNVKIIVNSS
jgi:hypothetical protein